MFSIFHQIAPCAKNAARRQLMRKGGVFRRAFPRAAALVPPEDFSAALRGRKRCFEQIRTGKGASALPRPDCGDGAAWRCSRRLPQGRVQKLVDIIVC